MRRYLTPFVNRDMQIKAAMKNCYTPSKMANIKDGQYQVLAGTRATVTPVHTPLVEIKTVRRKSISEFKSFIVSLFCE